MPSSIGPYPSPRGYIGDPEVYEEEAILEEAPPMDEVDEIDPILRALLFENFWRRFEELKQEGSSRKEFVELAQENKSSLQGEVSFDLILVEELENAETLEDFRRISTFALMDTIMNGGNDFPRLVEAFCELIAGNDVSALAILSSLNDPMGKLDLLIEQYGEENPLLASYFSFLQLFFLYGRSRVGPEFNINQLRV